MFEASLILMGGFLGGATGFLLGKLNVLHPLAGLVVGAATGMLVVLVLLELHRRLQPSLEVMDALRLRPRASNVNGLPSQPADGITGDPHP